MTESDFWEEAVTSMSDYKLALIMDIVWVLSHSKEGLQKLSDACDREYKRRKEK